MNKSERANNRTGLEIAVIGMAGRFPEARNIEEFWENLKNGLESISFLSDEELEEAGVEKELLDNIDYVKAGGYLEGKDTFDALFFGYSPIEAELMDPQLRIFHECVWEALEDAGYNPGSYDERIGLYAGASNSFHWQALSYLTGKSEALGTFAASQLTDKDFLCSRVSYNLDLKGASSHIKTACSTALVAIHQAFRALLTGESEMVLAGGVSISPASKKGYLYQEGMILSPDGHCRAFDAQANGTVGGEGVGIVVLKRLESAIEDNDHIYAIIGGTAINNDGKRKVGFTAPSVEAQAEVIRTAQRMARMEAESITYIEAHGTGTSLGDPVEIEALKLAFNTKKKNYCAVGSVKTNFGHLDTAAGIAGFIKTVLALKYQHLPPSLHFNTPNSKIDLGNSPFYVNTSLKKWESNGFPLRAGVSSFGIGGTNAHVVLEEFQDHNETKTGSREQENPKLILLSARTPNALDKMTQNLVEYFRNSLLNHGPTLADVAYTLQVGRKTLPHRKMLVCSTVEQTIAALTSPSPGIIHTFHLRRGDKKRDVIFMFPGQGSQYVDMGLELYRTQSIFREELDRCFEILKPAMEYDIKEILYPSLSVSSVSSVAKDINQTEVAQPLLFAFEYALAELLMKWGIEPYTMIGHSIGEFVAAHLSGVFSLEDGLKLAAQRGRLMQQMPPGSMVSVPIPEQQLIPLLNQNLSLAAVNGPSLCVVSGPRQAVASFEKQMGKQGYDCRKLHTSHAFHSTMMEPILGEFKKEVARVTLNKAKIPYISGLSGNWITPGEVTDPGYWARHLRETVRFSQGLEKLLNKRNCLFLEVGPGNVLSSLVKRHNQQQPDQRTIHFVRHSREKVSDSHFLLNKIGELWFYGKSIDWSEFYRQQERHRLPLPTYPFERQRYWIEEASLQLTRGLSAGRDLLKKKQNTRDWFYIPLWKQSPPGFFNGSDSEPTPQCKWLVFMDNTGIGTRLQEKLQQKKQRFISVKPGAEFTRINDLEFIIHASQAGHYVSLFTRLLSDGDIPDIILHLWNVTGPGTRDNSRETVQKDLDHGYFSLLYQAQAIEKLNIHREIQIMVVTDNMQEVTGEEDLCPGKAAVLGPAKVIPQEYRNISCRCIDIPCPKTGDWQDTALINRLLREFQSPSTDTTAAYRGSHRWIQIYESAAGEKTQKNRETPHHLRHKGVYLVTGGLGRIGMVLAKYLAAAVKARLVLTGRSAFPARKEWQQWLSTHKNDSISQKIKEIQELEKMGAELLVMQADVADQEQMQQVILQAEKTFAPVNGVIHAAGIVGEKTLQAVNRTDQSQSMEQFRPKVDGLLVLEKILENKSLDFCLLCSSLASVLGGLGFTAYSAANIFMDYFVRRHNRYSPLRWTSINWDGWDFRTKDEVSTAGEKNTIEFSLVPREGIEIFEYIFSGNSISQIVVSTGDLQTRIDQWVTFAAEHEEIEPRAAELYQEQGREHLSTTYVAPANSLQQNIIETWEKFFGIKPIGIIDDFFELGGDSLTAVTAARKLHKKLHIVIPLAEFFNRPNVKELAEYINQAEKSAYSSIDPAEEKEYYVLSSAQKRLYVLQQMDLTSTAYNQYHVGLLEGKLDHKKFAGAFKTLIQRHEILRSSIFMVKDKAVQKVHREVEFSIEYYDLATDEENHKLQNINYKQISNSESQITNPKETEGHHSSFIIHHSFVRPFDLSQPPFLRVKLIKRGEQQHILFLDMHHLVTDGVSFEIFIQELGALYGGQDLPLLTLQYKDYSEWQETQKQQGFIKNQEGYWLNRFQDEVPVLQLAADYPRPVIQAFEGSSIAFALEQRQKENLKKLGLEQDATLFMVILAVINIFLAKLSGQKDIVIGSPVAGRTHADLQYIMGIFVNTLALRNKPNGEKTFYSFLKEVKENAIRAFENQEYPFENLVENAAVNRDVSRNPLFDVMFVLQNVEIEAGMIPEVQITDLKLKFLEQERKTAKFDLTLMVVEKQDRLACDLEYSTKLFKKETIERYITYFKQLVISISENPGENTADIDMVPGKEKKQVLETFSSGPQVWYPSDKTIHCLFQEQAEKTPHHVALVEVHEKHEKNYNTSYTSYISYKELNHNSDRLACLLKQKVLQPDTIVGIMVERSIEMFIGILGILKAGGAYLPIDPAYPKERIEYMLKESNAQGLVVDDTLYASWLSFAPKVLLNLSEGHHLNFPASQLPSFPASLPSSLVYVIYTSGSTGRPKGTPISHANVNNYSTWFKREFQIGVDDRFCFAGSFCFDMSVTALIVPLISGASICTTREKIELAPQVYTRFLAKNRTSMVKLTPTQFRLLLDFIEDEDLAPLRYIILGGEAVDVNDIRHYLSIYKQQRIVNEYGPTEATVATVFHVVGQDDFQGATDYKPTLSSLPIGRPVSNTRVYILDKYTNMVPPSVIGELCIGGKSVAPGYLNKPELTAEKFDHDKKKKLSGKKNYMSLEGTRGLAPLLLKDTYKGYLQSCSHSAMRLAPHHLHHSTTHHLPLTIYHTGDLARWLCDGNIEFIGRMDQQVKVRGFRIELGEIEYRLSMHPDIREAVVAAKKNDKGDTYLCAYYVSGRTFTAADFRAYLSGQLPDYMIPVFFVPLQEIPLTPAGKINRRGLPEPEASSGEDYEAPLNDIQEKLAVVWQEVLGIEKIGTNDDFFEMGGDSIKAIQVSARLLKYKLKLEIRDLFTYPRIKLLEKCVQPLELIVDQGVVQGEVPLTPIQAWFFEKHHVDRHHFNQPVMLYHPQGFDTRTLERIFNKILWHHDALRMVYKTRRERIVQENRGVQEKLFDLEVVEITGNHRSEIQEQIETACARIQDSIDLEKGPLVKLGLFKTGIGDYLLIAVHHLVIDGVSWRILFENLADLYRQEAKGEELKLPLKTTSFKEWAEKLLEYGASKELLAQIPYWQEVENTTLSPLPKDRIAAGRNFRDDAVASFTLSAEYTEKLLTGVYRAYNTQINDILLASLGMALKKWVGLSTVVVELEGHGRENIIKNTNVFHTVGWFTSLYPVVLDLKHAHDLSRLVITVKETLRNIPLKGIGYGILKYLTPLDKRENLEFRLQPEISFNYLGQFDREGESDSFRIADISTGSPYSLNTERIYTFDIVGMVSGGKLKMSVRYNKQEYDEETILGLVQAYQSSLQQVIDHCMAKKVTQLTVSDLSLTDFNEREVAEVFDELEEAFGS